MPLQSAKAGQARREAFRILSFSQSEPESARESSSKTSSTTDRLGRQAKLVISQYQVRICLASKSTKQGRSKARLEEKQSSAIGVRCVNEAVRPRVCAQLMCLSLLPRGISRPDNCWNRQRRYWPTQSLISACF